MLLSREAIPTFELNGLGVGSASAVVTSMSAEAPSTAPSTVVWLPGPPQGPLWDLGRAAGGWQAFIAPKDEPGGSESRFDEDGSGVLIDPENGSGAADVPDPLWSPDYGESVGELFFYGLDGLPAIPWTPDHTVEGSLNDPRAQAAYKVPVGPETGSLTLTLRPARDGSEISPVIDKLFLVDPTGLVIARITTAPMDGVGEGGGQQLLVMLPNAPEGSELVIHLALGGAPSPASPGGGAGSGGGGFEGEPPTPFPEPAGFSLNIQRNDPKPAAPPEETSPISPPPAAPLGTPPSPPINVTGGWGSLQSPSIVLDGLTQFGRGWSAGASTQSSARSIADPDSPIAVAIANGSPSAYLGPLVSRGAAPLGPTLATSTDEPTQLIDRENHAVDEAIDRMGAELDSGLLASLKHRDASAFEGGAAIGDRAMEGDEAPEAPTAAIPGPGGMPVLVSQTSRVRPLAEAGALAAHLQSRSVEEALTAEIPGPPPMADQIAGELEAARAGLATRAAGLIVGLGLATGPLYPDLIALARKKLARAKRPAIRRRWLFRGGRTRPVF